MDFCNIKKYTLRVPSKITNRALKDTRLEELFTKLDAPLCVLKRINGHNCSIKQGEILRQSILKKAFEGKLVSQESNDEPAEVLLQRAAREDKVQK